VSIIPIVRAYRNYTNRKQWGKAEPLIIDNITDLRNAVILILHVG